MNKKRNVTLGTGPAAPGEMSPSIVTELEMQKDYRTACDLPNKMCQIKIDKGRQIGRRSEAPSPESDIIHLVNDCPLGAGLRCRDVWGLAMFHLNAQHGWRPQHFPMLIVKRQTICKKTKLLTLAGHRIYIFISLLKTVCNAMKFK